MVLEFSSNPNQSHLCNFQIILLDVLDVFGVGVKICRAIEGKPCLEQVRHNCVYSPWEWRIGQHIPLINLWPVPLNPTVNIPIYI